MIDSHFRGPFQTLLVNPLVQGLASLNISPNMLTGLGLAFGVCIPIALNFHSTVLALIFLVSSGFLDILDGSLARINRCASPKGAVFDIISDRIVEAAIVLGLFLVDPEARGLGCLLMLASILICVTSFLVVGIFENNQSEKSFHYSPGIMERTEAFIIFALLILLPEYFQIFSALFTFLVLITGVIRAFQFSRR